MFCREQSITAASQFGAVAAPIKCRSWTCPNCAEMRQRQLQGRLRDGKPTRMILLTCRRGQVASPNEAARALADAWRTVVRRWRRLKGYHKCEYFCVFEQHQSGWPHLHILWQGHWISQKWLSQVMTELLNSPVQSVLKIRGVKQAAYYVTKYFSKAPHRFGKSKRYWFSKGWPKSGHTDAAPAFPKHLPKEIRQQRVEVIVADWQRHGRRVWTQKPDIVGWGHPGYQPPPPPDRPIRRLRYRGGHLWFRENGKWTPLDFDKKNGGQRD